MRKNSTYEEKRKAGFTLVELIVVLVMLSILTAVAVPTYMGYVDDNKAKQCETHRKALASRLEEMSAMGSTASLTEDEMNSAENGCPAGGKYTLEGSGNTIHCDKHGDTTVILKSTAGIVTADVNNVQTEAPKETATPTPTPTPTPVPTPVIPSINLSLESGSKVETKAAPDMEVEGSQTLNVYTTANHCQGDTSYTWTESGGAAQIESGAGTSTVTIKAVSAGTSVFTCWATATSDVDNTTAVKSNSVTISVKVNEKSNLSISFASDSYFTIATTAPQSLQVNTNSTRCSDIEYFWTVTQGNEEAIHINSNRESATVTADQAGDYAISCQATARSDADGQLISSNTVTATIKVSSLSISVDTSSVSDEVEIESPISLTALPTPQNCTVSRYNWWLEDGGKGILSITEGWTAQTVIINAQTDGSCKVYCQAFAKTDGSELEISSNIVEIPVKVKKEEKETGDLLKDAPNPILINACTSGNGVEGKVAGIYDRLRALENIKGGLWASSDTSIADFICHTLNDQPWNLHMNVYQAGTFELTYTVNGQSETINAKVVYPHTDFQITGHNGLTGENAARVGDTIILTAKINGDNSTDGPLNWVNDTPALVDISDISKEERNTFIVKAKTLAAGTVTLHVSLQNEFTGEIDVKDISFDVTDTPRSARQVDGDPDGKVKFNLTEWDELRNAIKSGQVDDLPLSNLYYTIDESGKIPTEDNGATVIVYIRRAGESLDWTGCNNETSFKDYLAINSNKDKFIEVRINKYNIPGFNWMNGTIGKMITNGQGRYFVCIKEFNNGNVSAWSEEELLKYFVEIPIA